MYGYLVADMTEVVFAGGTVPTGDAVNFNVGLVVDDVFSQVTTARAADTCNEDFFGHRLFSHCGMYTFYPRAYFAMDIAGLGTGIEKEALSVLEWPFETLGPAVKLIAAQIDGIDV